MTKTRYGYLHNHYGLDMDGTSTTFEWVADEPMKDDHEYLAGWYAKCEVEPEAGWIGPFSTESEAIAAATGRDSFDSWQYGDDPMGDHMGRNV